MNEPRIQPVTLRFEDRALEREFRDRYHDQSIRQMRFGLMMGLFLYSGFGLLDIVAAPGRLKEIWLLRFGIACPLIAVLLIWSFLPSWRWFSQIGTLILGVVCSVAIIAMTVIAPAPTNYLYQTGVMAVLMFISTVMRLRFIYTLWTAVIVIAAYNAVALTLQDIEGWIIVNHNFFLFTAMVIGGFAAYGVEHYARRNFLQSRTIEMKNEEMSVANRELVESRALIIESSRRAQLIFSALAEALPGTRLDEKYEVGEKIGAGGFATVYRGRHLLLDAPVAIKIFRPSSATDLEKSFERFRMEGISAKKINHPNAVEVMDFGIAGSAIAFLVMELLEGHTLADELRTHGRRSPRRAAEIIVPVCAVLSEAHRLGIIHRDIKPGNIFLHQSQQGEIVKVVDFGIAKATEQSNSIADELTATGALIGTPSYMAPERFHGGAYGVSSDIYSVGVLLFQMLTGQLPARVESESNRVRDIPSGLADLIMKALAADPNRRPSAYEMATTIAMIFDLPLKAPIAAPFAGTPRLTATDVPTEVRSMSDEAVTEVSDRDAPTRGIEESAPAQVPRRLRGSE